MQIQCEKCQTRYNLDEAKIPGKGAKVTCPTCKHVFIVMKDGGAPAPAMPSTPSNPGATVVGQPKSLLDSFFDDGKTAAGAPRPGPVGAAPVRGIRSWKVRVASGLVYDFTDPSTLKTWIAERKVTTADQISADGQNWTAIGSIPNLDGFFGTNPAVTNPALTMPPTQAPPTNPNMPAAMPAFGAPGVPPVTGFGPAPTPGAPLAPAFAAAPPAPGADFFTSTTNPQMAPPPNPFGAPPPAADPFGGAPLDPFGGAPPAAANPFGAAPAAPAPFAGGNPFGTPAGGFGAGQDPFASAAAAPNAPPAPGKAGDLFGGSAVSSAGNVPFGGGAAPAPPANRPPPAPWSMETPGAPATPTKTPSGSSELELDGGNGRRAPARPAVSRPKMPLGAVDTGSNVIPKKSSAGRRGVLRTLGLGLLVIAVVGAGVGVALNLQRVKLALFPQKASTPKLATTPRAIPPLDGEARTAYLVGRRYMLVGQREAYDKAAESFRKALEKAPGNPRATAELLETLSLSKDANGAVTDAMLNKAAADAVTALRDDPTGVETNRALAQYYATTGHTPQAKTYLDAALAARAGDPEALLLRAELAKADPAKAEAVKADLAAAAKEPRLSRAQLAWAAQLSGDEQAKAKVALEALSGENKKTLAALDGGSYAFTPDETTVLMGTAAAAAPTPAPSAAAAVSAAPTAAAASPVPTAVVVVSAKPTATAVATPKATATKLVAAKTPKPKASPAATEEGLPVGTEVAIATPVEGTPAPAATPAGEIATAGAEDHWVAGNVLAQAGSWEDALAEYREAQKASPKTGKYQLAVATALFQTGKLQDAAEMLEQILERDANNAAAHRVLGLIYESTGQTSQACGEFTDFLRLSPRAREAADIKNRVARYNCGG